MCQLHIFPFLQTFCGQDPFEVNKMLIENKTMDDERALYGSSDITVKNCRFDGPADGESALKESSNVTVLNSYFNLRYPLWHVRGLNISSSEMTGNCRAAMWYSDLINIRDSKLHGIKALRECEHVLITTSSIISPEFGWSIKYFGMSDTTVESEYFLMRSSDIIIKNLTLKGKYSFQYVENCEMSNSVLNTKDAFWHAKNINIKNTVINGEYMGWYSENMTLTDCTIKGTQPFCYCKNLNLVNCRMEECDLAFERSHVNAEITTPVLSIKNPLSGKITVPAVGEIIRDIPGANGEVIVKLK